MYQLQNLRLKRQHLYSPKDISYDMLIEEAFGSNRQRPLRVSLVKASGAAPNPLYVDFEATVLDGEIPHSVKFPVRLLRERVLPSHNLVVMHVVPTGLRAAIGGGLGDAMPVNLVLSRMGALVVGHPNIFNAGPVNVMDGERMLYVEGHSLDLFSKGRLILEPVRSNRIGVVIGRVSDSAWATDNVYNQISHVFAHTGFYPAGIVVTDEPVGGKALVSKESGAMFGEVENIETVVSAAERLVRDCGATAIAIFTHVEVPEEYWRDYFKDYSFPNPVGEIEAKISRSVAHLLGIPCAHAPFITEKERDFLQSQGAVLYPGAAGDAAVPYYIGSVLKGLQQAPRLVSNEAYCEKGSALNFSNISALICPAGNMGGVPMMRADKAGTLIIGVRQNTTVLNVTAADLRYTNAIEVETYLDAIGLLDHMKNQGDCSVRAAREIVKEHSLSLAGRGTQVCESAGINPATLLRPLSLPVFL